MLASFTYVCFWFVRLVAKSVRYIRQVRPSVYMYQRDSYWTDLRETLYMRSSMKICR